MVALQELNEIESLLEQKRHKLVIDKCSTILIGQPENEKVLRLLLAAYVQKSDLQSIISLILTMRDYGIFDTGLHLQLIKAYNRVCRFDLALTELNTLHYKTSSVTLHLKIEALTGLGKFEEAEQLLTQVLYGSPEDHSILSRLANILHNQGKKKEAINTYLKAYELAPDQGNIYWGLANIKSYQLEQEQFKAVERLAKLKKSDPRSKMHACYALGKAYEDKKDYRESFNYYKQANDAQRSFESYDPHFFQNLFNKTIQYTDSDFFTRRKKWGFQSHVTPIFIVGLPRSGTTLMEQILASHNSVEATSELSNIICYARQISLFDDIVVPNFFEKYLENLSSLDASTIQSWGNVISKTRLFDEKGYHILLIKCQVTFGIFH
ncbi:tetratricopeptide repeat-containing sulfotransferase family protein [Catenovulum sediminis]|uniref:tetratricopeptide repeat-containing sulfotransferase family protein n=1 Tax=Catenovulum sediminis TaxID=1740262 RepID=UPI00117E56E7|nr:sulfotransferase [Catenovulum sediminis]